MFDDLTSEKLQYYVYALINPINNKPFYIGKGKDNRVFAHKQAVLNRNTQNSLKEDEIVSILESGLDIKHIIIRHGLKENESFLLESTLIDFANYFDEKLKNIVSGHESDFYGIKTTDEIIRQYNAPKLEKLHHAIIIININSNYASARSSSNSIYEATKQAWVVSQSRRDTVKFALSEFEGIIIGVFEIKEWYPVITQNNKLNNRWGFIGQQANAEIRDLYLNKSIMHVKKRGAANPIRYNI